MHGDNKSLYWRLRFASMRELPRVIQLIADLGNGWRVSSATIIPGTPFVVIDLRRVQPPDDLQSWETRLDFEKGILLDEPFDMIGKEELQELVRLIGSHTGG